MFFIGEMVLKRKHRYFGKQKKSIKNMEKSVFQIRPINYLIPIIKPFHLCTVPKEYLFHINVVISLRLGVFVVVVGGVCRNAGS